jgi:chemotaxis protein CheC
MRKPEEHFSAEQLDYLREMMSIGGGQVAGALTQLLGCDVDMKVTKLHIAPFAGVAAAIGNPSGPVAGVRMEMVGDVKGYLYFIVTDENKKLLIELVEKSLLGAAHHTSGKDLSVLMEIGNIVAGVHLVSLHDFCGLNIYHSVPVMAIDMIQALLDEAIVIAGRKKPLVVLVQEEFIIVRKNIRTFFLLIPFAEHLQALADSIGAARKKMHGGKTD